MDHTSVAVASAVTFTWLGMVVAISFLETPLKFRAPGVTIPIGLGIGRLVFRALNTAEIVLASALVIAIGVGRPPGSVIIATVVAVSLLLVQVGLLRPRLRRHSDRVLAGEHPPRSQAHLAFIALEVTKVITLITLGVTVVSH